MGKRIEQIPQATMNAFLEYSWPGNVRELQNLIERAVIRSDDGVLPNPLPTSQQNAVTPIVVRGTLRDTERALILKTLRATGGIVGGPRGAAVRLGLKRTTLITKMKKLGIYQTVSASAPGWSSTRSSDGEEAPWQHSGQFETG
jgi:transcriptional regulator of acetoin/glycerol metabolism